MDSNHPPPGPKPEARSGVPAGFVHRNSAGRRRQKPPLLRLRADCVQTGTRAGPRHLTRHARPAMFCRRQCWSRRNEVKAALCPGGFLAGVSTTRPERRLYERTWQRRRNRSFALAKATGVLNRDDRFIALSSNAEANTQQSQLSGRSGLPTKPMNLSALLG